MKKIVSYIILCFSILFLFVSFYLFWQRIAERKLVYQPSLNKNVAVLQALPKYLNIPSLNLHLPVYTSEIKKEKWETTKDGVSFLLSSGKPGEYGNTVIYGHNWNSLLGKLDKLKPGQEIEIEMTNGTRKNYIAEFIQVITQDQIHILKTTTDNRLTIFTCTGFLDSKRLVVTASLQKLAKN